MTRNYDLTGIIALSIAIFILIFVLSFPIIDCDNKISLSRSAGAETDGNINSNESSKNLQKTIGNGISNPNATIPYQSVNLTVNTIYVPKAAIPLWNVNFTLKAFPDSVLKEIGNVTYHVIPASDNMLRGANSKSSSSDRLKSCCPSNGFLDTVQAVAGYPLSATIFFNNGTKIERTANVETNLPYEALQTSIKYQNLNVTIDGKLNPAFGNIANVDVTWGDDESPTVGNLSPTYSNFPFSHVYAEKALYTIAISVKTTRDIVFSTTIHTNAFSSSLEERLNAKLSLDTNLQSQTREENIPFTLSVWGDLKTYFGNEGIPNKNLSLELQPFRPEQIPTTNGHYYHQLSIPPLSAGLYKLIIRGIGNYSSINQTKDIVLRPHQLTINDLLPASGAIIGIASGVSGVISGLAVYIVNRFRIRNLSNAMTAIVNKYKNYKESPDENNKGKYIHQFEDMREEVLKLLQKGKIDENKYKMLDDQISSYIQNISKDLEKSKSGH